MAGVKLAFCTLLWKTNGGRLDSKGRPVDPNERGQLVVIQDEDLEEPADSSGETVTHKYARGMCEALGNYNCSQCPLMHTELSFYQPHEIHWLCPVCVGDILRADKKSGQRKLIAPGHYAEGVCTNPVCPRPSRLEEAEGLPGVPTGQIVELPPGYSDFLQLVIGTINFNT